MHDSNDDNEGGERPSSPKPSRESGVAATVVRPRSHEQPGVKARTPPRGTESTAVPWSSGAGSGPSGPAPSFDDPTLKKDDPLIGTTVGQYVVRRKLGAGGMGLVYEAEQPKIGRKVAIKILKPELSQNLEQMRNLQDEARASNAIRHRGIVDIFDFGEIPGVGQYMVMELLEGEALDAVIDRKAPMLASEVIPIIDETLAALSAAHAVGVIHRDLKPSNIFIVKESSGSSYVKLLDFGLAKQALTPHGMARQTRASVMVGTPEYMAPEQACGQTVGPMSDLYAVGVLAFEMLTGRLPFLGDNPVQIAIQQVNNAPPRPSEFAHLPEELDALIMDLLEKDPQKRPSQAELIRQRLRRISQKMSHERTVVKAPLPAPSAPEPKKSPATPSVLVSPSLETPPSTQRDAAIRPRRLWPILGGAAAILVVAAVILVARSRASDDIPNKPPEHVAAPAADTQKPPHELVAEKPVAPKQVEPVKTEPVKVEPEHVEPAVVKKETPPKVVTASIEKPKEHKAPAVSLPGHVQFIFTNPRWCVVRADGQVKGTLFKKDALPNNTLELPAGTHLIELEQGGTPFFRQSVTLGSNQLRKVTVN